MSVGFSLASCGALRSAGRRGLVGGGWKGCTVCAWGSRCGGVGFIAPGGVITQW